MFSQNLMTILKWALIVVSSRGLSFPLIERESSEENVCLLCHGNQRPSIPTNGVPGPLLPEAYQMRWHMYENTSVRPPHTDPRAVATNVIEGETYYDASIPAMTEIYRGQCIDIFPNGREFGCQFLSIKSKTYFINFEDSNGEPKSCCNWREAGFWAPRPDVLRNMVRDNSSDSGVWYVLDIPLPGPFGYRVENGNLPGAFWFPVIGGWVQQEFYDVQLKKPLGSIFEIPDVCRRTISSCDE